jgi:hypothetical protein
MAHFSFTGILVHNTSPPQRRQAHSRISARLGKKVGELSDKIDYRSPPNQQQEAGTPIESQVPAVFGRPDLLLIY